MRALDCFAGALTARSRPLSPPALALLAHAASRRCGGGPPSRWRREPGPDHLEGKGTDAASGGKTRSRLETWTHSGDLGAGSVGRSRPIPTVWATHNAVRARLRGLGSRIQPESGSARKAASGDGNAEIQKLSNSPSLLEILRLMQTPTTAEIGAEVESTVSMHGS